MTMTFQFMKPWNLLYLKNEFINWAHFLNADGDAIIFYYFTLTLLFDF